MKLLHRLKLPFQNAPDFEFEDYSSSHINVGSRYHSRFYNHPGRSLMMEYEHKVLTEVTQDFGNFQRHLDFAGGTGRIAKIIENVCNEQTLLDISDEMLSVARNNLSSAKIVLADFRDNTPQIDDDTFDLVTAFRFFPNAEKKLKATAMQYIASKTHKHGLLICNNHRNFWSIPYITQRMAFVGGGFGMTNKEMIHLATDNGFELIKTYSIGCVPQTDFRSLLPWAITNRIEGFFFKYMPTKHRLGYNVIFVFRKQ